MRSSRACLFAVSLIVALVAGLALGCVAAHAAALDDAIAHFTADDFDETITGISQVTASGDARAAVILQALQNGTLMFSAEKKSVYIQDDASKLTDAATGQPVPGDPPDDLDNVHLNNRVRGALDAALGALTLLSPDPAKRFDAAQAVFKSREATALPALEAAIAKEQDPSIKRAMLQAHAAIVLNSADAKDADKLAAVDAMAQRADQDALGLLSSLPAGRRRRW
jgi:urea transport system permease protein